MRTCNVRATDERLARASAQLRTAVGGVQIPPAVDAIVVALADDAGGATVLTSDRRDLRALACHAANAARIEMT